jgi:2-polyprenyl-3-methyl-5-hydroxy-6-metoxy-1,4-benzoquinol methylase
MRSRRFLGGNQFHELHSRIGHKQALNPGGAKHQMNSPTVSEPMQKQPMETSSAHAVSLEEARIRTAYAKRKGDARYSWFNAGHLFEMQERERWVLASLKRQGISSLTTKNILEIGCGTGYWLREFIKWGAQPANLNGVDLLPDLVTKARQSCPASVRIYSS